MSIELFDLNTLSGTSALLPGQHVRMLVEARLVWGKDVLAVAHVRARGVVRVADFGVAGLERDRTVVFEKERLACDAIELDSAVLWLSVVDDADRLTRGALGEFRTTKGVALAAVLHATFLAMAFIGRGSVNEEREVRFETLKALSAAIDAREGGDLSPEIAPAQKESGPAEPKKGEPGLMGNPMATRSAGLANRSKGAEDPEANRVRELREAREFGMIGLLASPTSARTGGADPFGSFDGPSAVGSIFGHQVEDAFGFGGAALSGTGIGGGGQGKGVELAAPGFGQGYGCGCGGGFGLSGHHEVKTPVLRCGIDMKTGHHTCATQVNGRLPPETVQRVVRQNFGRMRACYQAGLLRDPSLEGRISVKFVIDRSGAVAMASTSERSFADSDVANCVERAFQSMSFPEPEGGIVTVVYPLVLST